MNLQPANLTKLVTILFLLFSGVLHAHAGKHTPHHRCETCTINGPTSITQGSGTTYTLTGCTTATWTVTNGETIQRSSSTSITIVFVNTGICNIETAGATGGGASINVSVTAAPLASGGINNPSQSINYGATPAQLSANAATGGSCSGSYSYQWYSSTNGSTYTPISGATGLNYQPGALTTTTYFEQVVTCNGVTATSNVATVTVYAQLNPGSVNPPSQYINYNTSPGNLSLTGLSGGNGTYTYLWLNSSGPSGFGGISGATSATYNPGPLTVTTYYQVAVTSNGVTTYSNYGVVHVYPQLNGGSISPASQSINYNTAPSTLTLSGVTGGSGTYTYQWQSSSNSSFTSPTNVGTGTTTYSPGALTATTYYRVAVTSNGVTVYSSTATVTVYPQLVSGSITPATQAINYNTTPASLAIGAATGGNGTYTYQWQSSPDGSTWTNISGSTSTTYSPGNLTATTYYRVVVTSNGVSVNSTAATVTVYPQLQGGSVSPSTQSINYNTAPSTLTASGISGGNGTYTYQWQSSLDNSTWSNISGATAITYSPGALTSTTYYRIVVTSNGVSANGSTATVTVYPALQGGNAGPTSQTINYSATPSTLTASGISGGSGTYTYQWQSSPDNSTWSNISGATSTTYSPGALTATTYYRLVVTSNGVSANSAAATVTVYPQLQGGSVNPSTQSINYNTAPSTLTVSGISGGSGSYTYQWQSSPDNSTWTNVSGATSATYSPGALTSTTYYRLIVTSNGVSAASSSATVTIITPLQAGTISPATQTIASGATPGTLSLTGTSGGNGSYSYVWQSSSDGINWSNAGSTTNTFSPGALTANTYYRVEVTSNGKTVNTNNAMVTIALTGGTITGPSGPIGYNTSPGSLGSTQPPAGGACYGSYSYQWQFSTDGSTWYNIPGATGASYASTVLTQSMYFRRQATCSGVTSTSNTVFVQVNQSQQSNSCPINQ